MSKAFKAWFKTQTSIPQGDYAYAEMAWDAAVEATKEKAAKVCENTREVQYFSTYNKTVDDAVATLHKAAAAIRSMK